MLPHQPLTSCQNPKQTNYKVESNVLISRRPTQLATTTGDSILLSPQENDDGMDADESGSSMSSSSMDSTAPKDTSSPILDPNRSALNDDYCKDEEDVECEDHDDDDAQEEGEDGDSDQVSLGNKPEDHTDRQDKETKHIESISDSFLSDSKLTIPTQNVFSREENGPIGIAQQLSIYSMSNSIAGTVTFNPSDSIYTTASDANPVYNSGNTLCIASGKNKIWDKASPKTSTTKLSPGSTRGGKSSSSVNGTKACAKKSFVWKYFRHPEMPGGLTDRSRTQCILCDSQLAFNASGTTTTMLNHLKSRHGDVAEREESTRRYVRGSKTTGTSSMDLSASADTADMHRRGSFGRALSSSNTTSRMSRAPFTVGQRGRPPGPNRRSKCSKINNDSTKFLSSQAMMQSGQMKSSDGTPLFPVC